jgi:hypothetical protein
MLQATRVRLYANVNPEVDHPRAGHRPASGVHWRRGCLPGVRMIFNGYVWNRWRKPVCRVDLARGFLMRDR